mmetsp:Transcript_10756/g.35309  ORF Transcript_10756/g.35309 Transcript_10756/m.35309 type:complete len:377 (+) Transcript_10756:139-1269(+)
MLLHHRLHHRQLRVLLLLLLLFIIIVLLLLGVLFLAVHGRVLEVELGARVVERHALRLDGVRERRMRDARAREERPAEKLDALGLAAGEDAEQLRVHKLHLRELVEQEPVEANLAAPRVVRQLLQPQKVRRRVDDVHVPANVSEGDHLLARVRHKLLHELVVHKDAVLVGVPLLVARAALGVEHDADVLGATELYPQLRAHRVEEHPFRLLRVVEPPPREHHRRLELPLLPHPVVARDAYSALVHPQVLPQPQHQRQTHQPNQHHPQHHRREHHPRRNRLGRLRRIVGHGRPPSRATRALRPPRVVRVQLERHRRLAARQQRLLLCRVAAHRCSRPLFTLLPTAHAVVNASRGTSHLLRRTTTAGVRTCGFLLSLH